MTNETCPAITARNPDWVEAAMCGHLTRVAGASGGPEWRKTEGSARSRQRRLLSGFGVVDPRVRIAALGG